jgi:hypothetical protein
MRAEIPKPIAIGIIVVLVAVALFVVYYFAGGTPSTAQSPGVLPPDVQLGTSPGGVTSGGSAPNQQSSPQGAVELR